MTTGEIILVSCTLGLAVIVLVSIIQSVVNMRNDAKIRRRRSEFKIIHGGRKDLPKPPKKPRFR